eukprot:CAMPEP_0195519048 /NCGR_PEP_ID=MMETSP0794_2-20130614/14284_1 /TAXON_ID=515487 /ORGANISM="Stephanopyxis turris, Strain CCMP 815" /LENGTH=210 /DNA_ID=CAMNT_0040648137 /DNA_START=33 /DNA_END=662 /DNA_ORIENTATION=-
MSGGMVKDQAYENERRRNNERAWRDLTGYVTSSGCPMWDKSVNVCIPKGELGIGYTVNCWALCCCYLCHKPIESTYRPTKRVWVFYVIIFAGILVAGLGIYFSSVLSQHCDGYHSNGLYYDYECPLINSTDPGQKVCCNLPCSASVLDNRCQTLQELGGDATMGAGIGMACFGLLLFVPGLVACIQNANALKKESSNQQVISAQLVHGPE